MFVHSCKKENIEGLYSPRENDYLCVSSKDSPDYCHNGNILIAIEGTVLRRFPGDIGSLGMTPKDTPYNEIHIADFSVIAIYIPHNNEFFTPRDAAIAIEYTQDILEENIKIIYENKEYERHMNEEREKIQALDDEEWNELMGI